MCLADHECLVKISTFVLMEKQTNNPLHGKTLENVLNELVTHFGWAELGNRIRINCFTDNPSIKSSLTFLRKTPWARKKAEDLYVDFLSKKN